jgi:hypothetical protein
MAEVRYIEVDVSWWTAEHGAPEPSPVFNALGAAGWIVAGSTHGRRVFFREFDDPAGFTPALFQARRIVGSYLVTEQHPVG